MPTKKNASLAYQTLVRFLPVLLIGAAGIGSLMGITLANIEQRRSVDEIVERTRHFFYQLERVRMRHLHSKLAYDIQKIVGADVVALYGPDCKVVASAPGNYLSDLRDCDSAISALPKSVIFPVEDLSEQVSHILVYKGFQLKESLIQAFLYLSTFSILVVLVAYFTVRFFSNRVLTRAIKSLLESLDGKGVPPSNVSLELAPVARVLAEFRSEILLREKDRAEFLRASAIASTAQMLAHDVRKPFSSVKMVIGAMAKVNSISDVKSMTALAIPEINRSMETVNGLIQDVMEIGSKSDPITESIDVVDLLDRALTDTFRVYPDSDVAIKYEFKQTTLLEIDKNKVLRVLCNIFGNGLQAMGFRGIISISSRNIDKSSPFIEFVITNDGPHIPAESIPHLFDAFFTSGKKGGTGLGLAIAHKIVTAHGGEIVCKSEPGQGVAFILTLPGSISGTRPALTSLSSHSSDFVKAALATQSFDGETSREVDELSLVDSFEICSNSLGKSLLILVADDERIYRDGLVEKLQRHPRVCAHLDIRTAIDPYQALDVQNSDLAIIDVDLACQAMNGFDVVAKLRSRGEQGIICTHSNRILATDHKTAIDHGADAFLPKPMSTVHLLKLLCQAAARARDRSENIETEIFPCEEKPENIRKLKFAFVDDSKVIRMSWRLAWKGGELVDFQSPESFWREVESNPGFLSSLACVITDFDFGSASKENGGTFASQLREKSDLPIFLASDGEFSLSDFNGAIDALLPKQPISMERLKSSIEKAKDGR